LRQIEACSQKEWAFCFLMFNTLHFTCLPQADVSFEPSALSKLAGGVAVIGIER
jgi:hypothetical protein